MKAILILWFATLSGEPIPDGGLTHIKFPDYKQCQRVLLALPERGKHADTYISGVCVNVEQQEKKL